MDHKTMPNGRRRPSRWGIVSRMLVLACLVAGTAGCAAKPEAPMQPKPEQSTPAPEKEAQGGTDQTAGPDAEPKPEHVYPYAAPLTGLGSDTEIKQRPVAVMVENQALARPQSGLDQADLVFEAFAEGGITRFVAVYQSRSPDIVGPVRSIRPYFVEIIKGLGAIATHSGGSTDGLAQVGKLGRLNFDEIYNAGAYFWRGKERKPPHNLYTAIGKIRDGAKNRHISDDDWKDPKLLFAKPDEPASGEKAEKISIPYFHDYTVTYSYDAESRLYDRYMNGEEHKDRESGTPIAAANVLVCMAQEKRVDSYGRLDIDVQGPGKGILFERGKARKVTWKEQDGIIRAFIDGKEVPLYPGQTWIQIVPTTLQVAYH